MAFFNDFKELFSNAAQSVTSKTKDGVEIGRIAGESRGIANELSTLYEQIGRAYVDGDGCEQLEPLRAKALELRERLEALERQKLAIRNQNRCPACGAVAAKEARFCSNCGRRMPEPAPEAAPEPAAQEICYCPECGAMKKEEEAFCPVCGHNCAETEEEPARAQTAPESAPAPQEDDSDEAPDSFEAD